LKVTDPPTDGAVAVDSMPKIKSHPMPSRPSKITPVAIRGLAVIPSVLLYANTQQTVSIYDDVGSFDLVVDSKSEIGGRASGQNNLCALFFVGSGKVKLQVNLV